MLVFSLFWFCCLSLPVFPSRCDIYTRPEYPNDELSMYLQIWLVGGFWLDKIVLPSHPKLSRPVLHPSASKSPSDFLSDNMLSSMVRLVPMHSPTGHFCICHQRCPFRCKAGATGPFQDFSFVKSFSSLYTFLRMMSKVSFISLTTWKWSKTKVACGAFWRTEDINAPDKSRVQNADVHYGYNHNPCILYVEP